MKRTKQLWVNDTQDDDVDPVTATTVHESEDSGPVWSDLYDANGDKLYNPRQRIPFGFHVKARR